MSSASVRFVRSLTQKPEQSKLTNPHCITPSAIAEVSEEELNHTLWKLTQTESAYLFIAGTRQRSLNSGQEKAAPSQAASM
jgi:hypothetical protein